MIIDACRSGNLTIVLNDDGTVSPLFERENNPIVFDHLNQLTNINLISVNNLFITYAEKNGDIFIVYYKIEELTLRKIPSLNRELLRMISGDTKTIGYFKDKTIFCWDGISDSLCDMCAQFENVKSFSISENSIIVLLESMDIYIFGILGKSHIIIPRQRISNMRISDTFAFIHTFDRKLFFFNKVCIVSGPQVIENVENCYLSSKKLIIKYVNGEVDIICNKYKYRLNQTFLFPSVIIPKDGDFIFIEGLDIYKFSGTKKFLLDNPLIGEYLEVKSQALEYFNFERVRMLNFFQLQYAINDISAEIPVQTEKFLKLSHEMELNKYRVLTNGIYFDKNEWNSLTRFNIHSVNDILRIISFVSYSEENLYSFNNGECSYIPSKFPSECTKIENMERICSVLRCFRRLLRMYNFLSFLKTQKSDIVPRISNVYENNGNTVLCYNCSKIISLI